MIQEPSTTGFMNKPGLLFRQEELMVELKRRVTMAETGEISWIDEQELFDFLKQRRNAQ